LIIVCSLKNLKTYSKLRLPKSSPYNCVRNTFPQLNQPRGFSKEFDPCIDEIVGATLTIYNDAKLNLLPTPAKSHYLFNLRDFSRVIQGVLLSVPEATEDVNSMRRLWVHEVLRVYGDRLVEDADRTWLFENICSTVKASFNTDPTRLFGRLVEKDKSLQESDFRQLIYCDFTNPKADTKNYVEVQDLEELRRVVEAYLVEYNNMSKKPMNLVLFRFAIEHLSRICRIIKQPRSHALLIGVGGSGRQSLTRLASLRYLWSNRGSLCGDPGQAIHIPHSQAGISIRL